MFANDILSLLKEPAYQELNAYYQTSTVFNILGLERNENRHSAFIAWLLNPAESHQLGENPLKQFLSLVAAHTYDRYGNADEHKCYYNIVRKHLITGNYSLEVDAIRTEQSIIGLARDRGDEFTDYVEKTKSGAFSTDAQNRFDIWMLLRITFEGDSGKDETWTLPLVVENKIYSKEGNAGDTDKAQTVRYKNAMGVIKNIVCQNNYCQPLLVYLTPERTVPTAKDFVPLCYQDLLDYVLSPLSAYKMPEDAKNIIEAYIQTLCTPVMGADGEIKDPNQLANSIMAIPMELKMKLSGLYAEYKDLYNAALTIAGGNKAETILGSMVESTEDALLLQNFWDSNITLFNTILYVCCADITSDTKQQKLLMDIFKASKRDTTKYIVLWDESGEGTDWKPVKGYDKGLTKGKAAAVFFMRWMEMNCPKTIEEVRQIFPTSINSYYNRKTGSFDSLIWFTADEVTAETESGFKVNISDVGWDLYPIVHNRTHDTSFGLGYGPVYDGYQKKGLAMIAKMWRKDDFENLLDYIQVNQQKYFSRIKIEKM